MVIKNVIQLKNVWKTYSSGEVEFTALKGINIDIENGDFVAIMGPSGSGKSTAMNLIGSLDISTKGEIYLDGQNIEELEESELAELRGKKIGFIFQRFNLIPNLTVKENVMLPMLFQDTTSEEREEKAIKHLTEVGLSDKLDSYPTQISGGQMQRVAIARALSNDPEVILADEPTGNLDSKSGEGIMNLLEELNKRGRTIIMVTHDEHIAKKHAKTIYVISDGKILKMQKIKRSKQNEK